MKRVTIKNAGIVLLLFLSIFSGAARAGDTKDSPFGFHPAAVGKQGYNNNGYGDAQNIGVKWARDGIYAFWFLIQPDLARPTYNFTQYDTQWSRVPAGMNILANIAPQGDVNEGRCLANSYLPVDEQKYVAFVRAVVQRYGGSSYAAAGLAAPIKYWQVGNEPNGTKSGFADLQRITYTAIKEVCPDCVVLIGGVPGMPPVADYISKFDLGYKPILDALGGQYLDILDFHWYGAATGDYRGAKDVYDHIRSVLNADGFPANLPIWITEMGAYSGDPTPTIPLGNNFDFPAQNERQQALDYFKRFVYPLASGVKKIFPAFGLMEGYKHDGGYFDYTGLIYDGMDSGDAGLGVKKLGYYTYKKMTEMLEGSDWNSIQTIQESGNVYIFKITKNSAPVYVAWWDYFDDPNYLSGAVTPVTVSGLHGATARATEVVANFSSGAQVSDYNSAFTTLIAPVAGGVVSINLGDSPVIIEEIIPRIMVSPASTDFCSVNTGSSSAAQTFTITNNGTTNLVMGTVTKSGANADQFGTPVDGCSSQTIAPSATCTIQAIYSPTSSGAKTANLLVSSNDPYTPTLTIPLQGTGLQYTLTVAGAAGSSSGTITGGNMVDCALATNGSASGSCTESRNPGTVVTLTATPAINAAVSWTNCPGSSGNTCSVTLDSDRTVTASFSLGSNHTVRLTSGTEGVVVPATSQSVANGTTTTFALQYPTGYHPVANGCSGVLNGSTFTTGAITADCTVDITFVKSDSIFNEDAYLAVNPDIAAVVRSGGLSSGWQHFNNWGRNEGRPLAPVGYGSFKEGLYLLANPDIAAAVSAGWLASGWQHYNSWGRSEGRPLEPASYGNFDEQAYLIANPDIAQAVQVGWLSSGWQHYSNWGRNEGRPLSPTVYGSYSEQAYLLANPDIAQAVALGWISSGWQQYNTWGRTEGRPAFPDGYIIYSEAGYLAANSDVAAAVKAGIYSSGYAHYLAAGKAERRPVTPAGYGNFSEAGYLAANSDIEALVSNGTLSSGWQHYNSWGRSEGRPLNPAQYGSFDEADYLAANPDLFQAVSAGSLPSGWYHYMNWGESEGRPLRP